MKKFGQGLFVGVLVTLLMVSSVALASNPIKLIVNGQEIKTDVAPQMINGRVMVPARFVAEPLGATVIWDKTQNAVVISSGAVEQPRGSDDLISARELHDKYGVSITMLGSAPDSAIELTLGSKTIETTDYKVIDDRLFFKTAILDELGI